ncbi:hypothetical protein Vqi01_59630 [Micromonospora qiuiae]|uniref:Uncharacterized protein n=1 Tax=Micromonospora qiuiae TaxID=502268 RepID=A0ABQ4JK19_9ACTN|nr:hypothetical protein Vqi01_59630 [Micromonospora qiuiae]
MRLRYSGSAHRWSLATYRASNNSYEDQYWFSGTADDALDFVCDVLISPITDWPHPNPGPSTPKDLRTEALRNSRNGCVDGAVVDNSRSRDRRLRFGAVDDS